VEVAKYLLANGSLSFLYFFFFPGADKTLKTKDGKSAVDFAKEPPSWVMRFLLLSPWLKKKKKGRCEERHQEEGRGGRTSLVM